MGSTTKQKPLNHQFINCEFEFECSMNWFDLTPTYDVKTKFCETCNINVHLCLTQEELDDHTEQRHCIAFFKEPDLGTRLKLRRDIYESLVPSNKVRMLTGYPASAKIPSKIFEEDEK